MESLLHHREFLSINIVILKLFKNFIIFIKDKLNMLYCIQGKGRQAKKERFL